MPAEALARVPRGGDAARVIYPLGPPDWRVYEPCAACPDKPGWSTQEELRACMASLLPVRAQTCVYTYKIYIYTYKHTHTPQSLSAKQQDAETARIPGNGLGGLSYF